MKRLLDTSVCVAYLRGLDRAVRKRLLDLPARDVCVCAVVKAELLYGARRSERVDANLRRVEAFVAPLASLPFDDAAAAQYAVLRAQLEREGRLIGANDMMIAAIALAADATLATMDPGDFRRVAGLSVEGW